MTKFIPGIALSRAFYQEAVRPLLDTHFPGLQCSAALIGDGSEVLGFDTPMSTDHCWGPRLQLFLDAKDMLLAPGINAMLSENLPTRLRGYSTRFTPPDPEDNGTQHLQPAITAAGQHRVDITTMRNFILEFLNFDINSDVQPADWLTFPEQKLLAVTSGAVFHDRIGLQKLRDTLAYYPRDVWLYLLAAGWNRIGQEEHLAGRAGYVGDDLGSAIIAARLVRDVMRLCFLMERRYAPYAKWFGTGFQRLACASEMTPLLADALRDATWQERDERLACVYALLARLHNRLGITSAMPQEAGLFFGRPFHVIEHTGRFASAITECINDAAVKQIARRNPMGGIDQVSDNTDLLSNAQWRTVLKGLYKE